MNRLDAQRESVERIVEEVAAVVLAGGLVIFPTDTVYGIGCDPLRAESVERIFVAKGRPRVKPLSLHVASVTEMLEYAAGNARAASLARQFLPGGLTIVVERPAWLPAGLTAGLSGIGLRVPGHALCLALLERCGPLAATSANLSGEPAFMGHGGAERLPEADLFIDAGPTSLAMESTIVDLSREPARVLREGAVPGSALQPSMHLQGVSS